MMLKSAFSCPKIRTLAVKLGIPFPHACGMCGMLWNFTADHAPAGDVGKYANDQIAVALEWPGDPDSLIAAFVAVRLLDRDNTHRLLVHNWKRHCPQYVRATLSRKGLAFASAHSSGDSSAPQSGLLVDTTSSSTSAFTSSSTSTSTYAQAAPAPAPTRKRSKPKDAIAWAPETGWTGITEADRDGWGKAYPACDIDRQLAAMAEWLRANPAKARKSAWRKFVANWLSRSQDKGGDIASNKTPKGQKVLTW